METIPMFLPHQLMTRRAMLQTAGTGFGYLALAGLANAAPGADASGSPGAASGSPLGVKQPHFAPKAKRVIMLTMRGGPSHVDTFDYKPALAANAGKTVTEA